jgi:hypothetical protein
VEEEAEEALAVGEEEVEDGLVAEVEAGCCEPSAARCDHKRCGSDAARTCKEDQELDEQWL